MSSYTREYLPFLPHTATLIAMYSCVVVLIGVLIFGLIRRYRKYDRGTQTLWANLRESHGSWRAGVWRAARDVFVQSKVRERVLPGVFHVGIFYGMVVLFIGTSIVVVYEDILSWSTSFTLGGLFYVLFEAFLDAAAVALVVGVGMALWRRLVTRPDYLSWKTSTVIVLFALMFMGLSGLGLEAYRIAAQPENVWMMSSFVGWSLSHLMSGWASADGAPAVGYQVFWWLHALTAFGLVGAVAYTGFSHLLLIPVNVISHDSARPRMKMTTPFNLKEAMETEEEVELVSGTATTADIAPVERLSADACVACGRCHEECPANAAGRLLSPRDLIQSVQATLGTNVGGVSQPLPAMDFENAVWSCTNCYACEQACPARIRHVDFMLDFRRALVDQNRLDEQKLSMLQALDRNQNPYKLPSHERAAWIAELPYADEILFGASDSDEEPEYLYWVGCSAAYDERASMVARATMDLLHSAGVSFVTLGPAEPCCGEPAKRLGEEGRFQMIAMTNVELIAETKAKRIVTHCPHGLNMFANEYPQFGLSLPVVHHTELLADLITDGKLEWAIPEGNGGDLVYHEPCNLARAGHPSGPALDLLRAASHGRIDLPTKNGLRTFCCGGGGGNSFYQVEPEERRISAIRLEQLIERGARTIVVSCPFCLAMLTDAAGSQSTASVSILDVAEVLGACVAQESLEEARSLV